LEANRLLAGFLDHRVSQSFVIHISTF